MDATTRPVIVARWITEDGRSYLETESSRISINKEKELLIQRIYQLANGRITIESMARKELEVAELVEFFNELEQAGVAFPAQMLAMYGHKVANYPDPLRLIPDGNRIEQLMCLPQDSYGEVQPISSLPPKVLTNRETIRQFSPRELPRSFFEQIVADSYTVVGVDGRRTVPSAGAMYPLQHDFVVFRVYDIEPGHYRLARQQNGLIRIGGYSWEKLEECLFPESYREAAVFHAISFDITRSCEKYSSRAYRFALVEAGHAAQNCLSAATSLGIGSWEYGGYRDHELEQFCDLDSNSSGIATTIFYGVKP